MVAEMWNKDCSPELFCTVLCGHTGSKHGRVFGACRMEGWLLKQVFEIYIFTITTDRIPQPLLNQLWSTGWNEYLNWF